MRVAIVIVPRWSPFSNNFYLFPVLCWFFFWQLWEIRRASTASRAPKAPALCSLGNQGRAHRSSIQLKTLCLHIPGGKRLQ